MARIPQLIKRNPLSQVAPQAAPAGQGWAALADLAQTAADFVKPAAEGQAREEGEKSVYRDAQGNLKVDERSLYSGEMGALQNQAAYAKYLSQKSIDINSTMSELAVKYEFDPGGFKDATDAYTKTLRDDPNVPNVLKEDVVRSVEEGASRQFNGLHRAEIDRTYKAADTQSATLRDMLMDDYVSLYVEGDEEGAAAKWKEIEELSRMRANAPYISETPAETEAMMRGARGTAKAASLLRDLADLEGADEISDEQRNELTEILKDPDIAPGTRQKLYAATQGRLKSIDAAGIVKNMTNDSYTAMVVRAESGGRNDAKASTSSAFGPHQFLKGTWAGLVKRYKPAWAKGLSEGQIQAMRGDRAASTEMFGYFRQENQAVLAKSGMPINPATEYMAHFFGAGGAVQVLAADPDTPLSQVVPAATIKANPFLKGMTARDAQNWAARKMTMKASDMAAMSVQIDKIEDPEVRRLASNSLNEKIAVRRNIEDAAASVFEERIATGDVSLTEQQIREDQDLSTEDQVRLTGALDKVNKQTDDLMATVTRMNTPGATFNSMDKKDVNAVGAVFNAAVGDAAPTSPEFMSAAASITKQTGIIPPKVGDSIRSAVRSDDPIVLSQALEMLGQLKDLAGGDLSSITGSEGLENLLSDYKLLGQFGSGEEAATQMIKNREKKPKNITDEAKEAVKKLNISDVVGSFDKSFFSDPKIGDSRAGASSIDLLTDGQENEMMAEYTRLFKDDFMETGDFEISQNRALDKMGRIYGINEVSGVGRIMKFPPQKMYKQVDGSYQWQTDQLVSEVNDFINFDNDVEGVIDGDLSGEVLLPDGRGDTVTMPDGSTVTVNTAKDLPTGPGTNRIERDQIALWSDDVSAREAKTGKPVSYRVYVMRGNTLEELPRRFTFDRASAEAKHQADFEAGRARRDERNTVREALAGDGETQSEIDNLFAPDLTKN
jgi:hypothetical protein